MSPEPDHAIQRFRIALDLLATGAGDVRSRLRHAAISVLCLRTEEFPRALQADYLWIIRMLTSRPPRFEGEGKIEATLYRMRNSTGGEIAERIKSMYFELLRYREHHK